MAAASSSSAAPALGAGADDEAGDGGTERDAKGCAGAAEPGAADAPKGKADDGALGRAGCPPPPPGDEAAADGALAGTAAGAVPAAGPA